MKQTMITKTICWLLLVASLLRIGISTPTSYVYDEKFQVGKVPTAPIKTSHEMTGDGTVNDRSLARAALWVQEQKQQVRYWTFNNTSHFGILKNQQALDRIVDLLVTFE